MGRQAAESRLAPSKWWAPVFALLAIAALAFIAPTAAAADPTEVLIERPAPFQIPLTYPESDAYVAAAAPGSNGTVHYLVSTRYSWYYIWANASTGNAIEWLNLSNLGFSATEFISNPSSVDWRMTAIYASGGHVVIARGSMNAIVDVVLLDEGQASNAIAHKLLLPLPTIENAALSGLALARNGSDPLRPSIIFTRSGYNSSYYSTSASDVGEIPIDLTSRLAPTARILWVLQNYTLYNANGYSYSNPIADAWREQSFIQPLAAAISSTGERWIFLFGYDYVCSEWYYPGYCYNYLYNLSWSALSPSGTRSILEPRPNSQYYPYYGSTCVCRLAAVPAPDGTVAGAAVMTSYDGSGLLAWTRASSAGITTTNVSFQRSPVTSADFSISGSELRLVVTVLENGTGTWPQMAAYLYTGWPSAPSGSLIGRGGQPLERAVVLEATSARAVLAGGTLRHRMTLAEGQDKGLMANVVYAGGWPVVATVGSSSTAYVDVRQWQTPGPGSVTGSAMVTLSDGSRVGALALMENGTGTLRVFAGTGTPPIFSLFDPVAGLDAPVWAVKAISVGDRALIVVQQLRTFFTQSTSNYQLVGYSMLLADNQGRISGPYSIYTSATGNNDSWGLMDWSLSAAAPRPLLFTSLGLFVLDPWNGTAYNRIELRQEYYYYSNNASKFLSQNDYIPSASPYTYYGNCYYSYGYYCGHPSSWWSESNHYYAAFLYSNYSYSSSAYYCNCVMRLRVIHWYPNDTVTRVDIPLTTGASNDTMYFQPYGDVTHVQEGSTHTLVASVTQTYVWDRYFRVIFNSASMGLSSLTLMRENPRPGTSYLADRLQAVGDVSVAMQTRESGTYYTYSYPITLLEAITVNASGVRLLAFANVTVTCDWYYWYYYPYYPYYNYFGCPRWTATSWGGETAFIVVKGGSVRFFAVNHAPTAPRLELPTDGTLLTSNLVELRVSQSVDPDNDPLVYRYDIFDLAGNRVQRVESPYNTLTVTVPDGIFHWTCSVSDGVLRVACIGNFSMRLDGTPPRADAGGPYQIHPGDHVLLDGSNSFDASGIEFYMWLVGIGGDLTQNSTSTRFEVQWVYLSGLFQESSMIPVTLFLRDGSGLTASAHTWIQLLDDPVIIEIAVLSAELIEGKNITLGANLTWGSIHASWLEGGESPSGFSLLWRLPFGNGAGGLRATFFAQDNIDFDVEVNAVAREGGVGSATVHLRIMNQPPQATGDGPLQLREHEVATYTVNATDPSPIDARNLSIEWKAEGGLSITPLEGMAAQVTGVANGRARVYATVRDKDGGATIVEFAVLVSEAADPARALYVASVGSNWIELRWIPTEESDFLRYEVTVFDAQGTLLRKIPLSGSRATSNIVVDGLDPSTLYDFELVVFATGEVRSPSIEASGTTAPAEVQEPPPNQPPPQNPENPRPNVTNSATPAQTVGTSGADAIAWLIFAVLAGLSGVLYFFTVSRRRRDSER